MRKSALEAPRSSTSSPSDVGIDRHMLRFGIVPAIASPAQQAVFFLFRRQRHAIRPFQLSGTVDR